MCVPCECWTHGTAMQIEYPEQVSTKRAGWGITVEGLPGQTNLFHFPIPTPVIIPCEPFPPSSMRLKVDSVMIQYGTSNYARIKHIYVNDGHNQIAAHKNLNLTANNIGADTVWNRFDVLTKPEVHLGIDIVIWVEFLAGEPNPVFVLNQTDVISLIASIILILEIRPSKYNLQGITAPPYVSGLIIINSTKLTGVWDAKHGGIYYRRCRSGITYAGTEKKSPQVIRQTGLM